MKHKIRIAVYGEQCLQAGSRCYESDKIARKSDDLNVYEFANAAELDEYIGEHENAEYASDYNFRLIETLRQASDDAS